MEFKSGIFLDSAIASGIRIADPGGAVTVNNTADTLAIATQQTYAGGTTIHGGTLDLTGGGGAGDSIRGTVTVNTGGIFKLGNGDVLGYNNDAAAVNAIHLTGGTMTSAAGSNQTTTAPSSISPEARSTGR